MSTKNSAGWKHVAAGGMAGASEIVIMYPTGEPAASQACFLPKGRRQPSQCSQSRSAMRRSPRVVPARTSAAEFVKTQMQLQRKTATPKFANSFDCAVSVCGRSTSAWRVAATAGQLRRCSVGLETQPPSAPPSPAPYVCMCRAMAAPLDAHC